ncbi:MAG: Ryanodine receptor Ryr [Muribaculaceae bacterium]|nr:Ryanodine receptor Ryr [Muribaculaceae bacterium]
MKEERYIPRPLETNDVELPEELIPLVEEMSKNVHENWAKNRLDEGWKYGPERNDKKMEHPCLVPYEDLPESEKRYDRESALQTLKLILKSGFTIRKCE